MGDYSIAPTFLIFITISSSSLASVSSFNLAASSISSAPALSPDISPLLPTPHLSPSQSSLPIIPSTPSPPKPDDDALAAPPPHSAVAPYPDSSSLRLLNDGGFLLVSALLPFALVYQFSG